MRAVYKYPLQIVPKQTIEIPQLCLKDVIVHPSSQVLKVEMQGADRPCMWCMVDTERGKVPVDVTIRMTGEQFEDDGSRYVGSFIIDCSKFVGHVFVG